MAEVQLASNQYGKAENRVVRVTRDTPRHEVADLNVTSQLRGDFEAAHTAGDNSHVVATDTQKNTIFAFAKDGIPSPEEFLLRLADHFTGEFDWVSGGRWAADQYGWTRINDHDHAFYRGSPEIRTATRGVASSLSASPCRLLDRQTKEPWRPVNSRWEAMALRRERTKPRSSWASMIARFSKRVITSPAAVPAAGQTARGR